MKIGMMQNNIKIAVTGGICSGKSTVSKVIEEQGYNVLSCDEIYSDLLKDTRFINLLSKEFGDIKNIDGSLNRSRLSDIVFSDGEKLNKLNAITHPKIMQIAMKKMSGKGIHFCEVPLLFEGGFEQLFDNIIVVLRDKDERINELMQRSKLDRNQAVLRINCQFEYENYNFAKYYVIHNDANLTQLKNKTVDILAKIVKDYN